MSHEFTVLPQSLGQTMMNRSKLSLRPQQNKSEIPCIGVLASQRKKSERKIEKLIKYVTSTFKHGFLDCQCLDPVGGKIRLSN